MTITQYAEREKERLALSNLDDTYRKLLNKRSIERSKARLGFATFNSFYDEIRYLTHGFITPRVMTSFSQHIAAEKTYSGKRYYEGWCIENSHFVITCHQDTLDGEFLFIGSCKFESPNHGCAGEVIVFNQWFTENLGILTGRYQYEKEK